MNDPPLSLLIVAAYVASAMMSARAAHASRTVAERGFWVVATAMLALLAINKPIDLQTLMIDELRTLARLQGWYEGRRTAQLIFLVIIAAVAVVATLQVGMWVRRIGGAAWVAAAGIATLLLFLVLKIAAHSHLDEWLGRGVEGLRHGWILELAGCAMIAWAARAHLRKAAEAHPPG